MEERKKTGKSYLWALFAFLLGSGRRSIYKRALRLPI